MVASSRPEGLQVWQVTENPFFKRSSKMSHLRDSWVAAFTARLSFRLDAIAIMGQSSGSKDCPKEFMGMNSILVATDSGCRVFSERGEGRVELTDRRLGPLASHSDGTCVAIVDEKEVWRRSADGIWHRVAVADIELQSICSGRTAIFCGGMRDAAIIRISPDAKPERLKSFEVVPGRGEWFAGGPPLGVRAITETSHGDTLLAAVHVGGIPRSDDGGETWKPTIPVMFDVHEVRAHPRTPNLIAAAAAVGLCVSHDSGCTWVVFDQGLEEIKTALAVAFLDDEVLFSVQESPFATRSRLWRWRIGGKQIEAVRDGLPEWLEGKVDTNQIASGTGGSAMIDGGGNLWHYDAGSRNWRRIATGLPYAYGLLVV
jgi:hypothetical protein